MSLQMTGNKQTFIYIGSSFANNLRFEQVLPVAHRSSEWADEHHAYLGVQRSFADSENILG